MSMSTSAIFSSEELELSLYLCGTLRFIWTELIPPNQAHILSMLLCHENSEYDFFEERYAKGMLHYLFSLYFTLLSLLTDA